METLHTTATLPTQTFLTGRLSLKAGTVSCKATGDGTGTAAATGTSIAGMFVAPHDGARIMAVLDGSVAGVVKVAGSKGGGGGKMAAVTLASSIPKGTHTLQFYKVTEDNAQKNSKGVMTFGGFVLDGGGAGAAFGP